ncbi:MAG: TOBE domain-containing protein, partial [Deltaproteobacteria bacterium]|nr:TOBE domain-containing protein [Deltaproteobacteria bacterium]
RTEIKKLRDRLRANTIYVTHEQVEAMTLADTLWVLNGGLVEQKGAPLEVYERPKTKFVATFLGSPKMTMLEGKLLKEAGRFYAEGGGVKALVSDERFGASLEEGRNVTIGIRPHDLGPAKNGAPVVAELKVELVEALGSEAFAHGWLRQAGPSVIARLDADDAREVRPGSVVPLAVSPARVHLFDPASGRALA